MFWPILVLVPIGIGGFLLGRVLYRAARTARRRRAADERRQEAKRHGL